MPPLLSLVRDQLRAATLGLLDPARWRDYLFAALFAGGPIIAARLVGNHANHSFDRTVGEVVIHYTFLGYWYRPNWYTHVVSLPVALYFLRWAMTRIAPITTAAIPEQAPGVVALVRSASGRAVAYQGLRSALLRPANLAIALVFTAIFSVLDSMGGLRMYFDASSTWTSEPDWSWVFVTDAVNKWANFAQFAYAYAVQGAIVTLLVLFLVLMVRHNAFFLGRVYQRRRVPPEAQEAYIVIDLDDTDLCFGFRRADASFNVQVTCLWIAGIGLMISRLANVANQGELAAYELLHRVVPSLAASGHTEPVLAALYPDFGQWVIVLAWLVGLAIVSMPALVKFLPRLPFSGAGREQATISGYLREFLPDSYWPFSADPSGPEVNELAARFAANAFWPTGNNRAKYHFTLAAFWGIALLFPIWPRRDNLGIFLLAFVLYCLLAYLVTWGALKALETRLVVVDPRLVNIPPDRTRRLRRDSSAGGDDGPDFQLVGRFDRRIFISYRRDDAVAWAGRLRDTLTKSCVPDRIFRDFETLPYGKNFAETIEEALAAVDVAIVLIGPRWLDAPSATGGRRLDDESDWVRIEITRALQRNDVLVVPALLGGARMPNGADLPEPLQPLALINAIELSDSRWDYDVDQLVKAMKAQFPASALDRE